MEGRGMRFSEFMDAMRREDSDDIIRDPHVMILTPEGTIYSPQDVKYEEPEEENPLDHDGTVWIQVEEL
jgi:hypothetical protein